VQDDCAHCAGGCGRHDCVYVCVCVEEARMEG
jgi:hypothetical protein